VNEAIKSSSVLSLSDTKGRELLVPSNKISFVEVGESSDRKVGFAN
jgi:beta-xylosidase